MKQLSVVSEVIHGLLSNSSCLSYLGSGNKIAVNEGDKTRVFWKGKETSLMLKTGADLKVEFC